MKSILFFEYFATGEGWRTIIRFTNNNSISDEMALSKLKSEYNEYFHCGFELINLDTIIDNKKFLLILQTHVPLLYDFVTKSENERKPFITINYEGYVNYE